MIRKKKGNTFRTVAELLEQAGQGKEEQLLFVEERPGGRKVTFGQWNRELLETAEKIRTMEGNHVGVVCDLSYACVLCLYAVIEAGKTVVPLEADLSGEELDRYVARADLDLLICPENRTEGEVTRCKALTFSEFFALPSAGPGEWRRWEEERPACIIFTSGTEGEPRGVVLTQRNLAFTKSYSEGMKLKRPPKMLMYLPIHHVFSLLTFTACICEGCEVHLSRSIKYVVLEIEQVKPDTLITVPMINELICGKIKAGIRKAGKEEQVNRLIALSNGLRKMGLDLRTPLFRSLREKLGGIPQLLISGGSAASEESIRYLDDIGILVLQAYGMTESNGLLSTNTIEENKIGSVGRPLPFLNVRVRDGEIQVRGENVMKEYYKDPEATARTFDGGWLKTGDLGYLDEDGYLFLTGRKKRLIITSSGENISPEELENRLLRCPAVGEVVVEERNGKIHAEIYPVPDFEGEVRGALEVAIRNLNDSNPLYKRILSWELRGEPFEKTASGKIRR